MYKNREEAIKEEVDKAAKKHDSGTMMAGE